MKAIFSIKIINFFNNFALNLYLIYFKAINFALYMTSKRFL